jgi:hypothetical protein
MTTVPPSGGPSFDDCYTTLLHNRDHDSDLTVCQRSEKSPRGCYTSDLHLPTHFVIRGGRIYYRRRVPRSLREIVGRREIWRSLETDSPTVALRRSHQVAASIEHTFEAARSQAGLSFDYAILRDIPKCDAAKDRPLLLVQGEVGGGATLRELYEAYMADPTRDWSARTRLAYGTTRRLVLAILGEGTLCRSITRAQCRDMIEVLRCLPRNASKLYPGLSPEQIVAKAKSEARTDLISPSNLNTYSSRNWCLFCSCRFN